MHEVPLHENLKQLTYAPLPLETHPIDIAYGPQGWGPFDGPWTPEDFWSPYWGINATWMSGDNATLIAPGYDIISLFDDPSIDFAANHSFLAELQRDAGRAVNYGNTIANGVTLDAGTVSASSQAGSRILKALGVNQSTS